MNSINMRTPYHSTYSYAILQLVSIYASLYVCRQVCMFVCMSVREYAYMRVGMYVFAYSDTCTLYIEALHTYTHTCITFHSVPLHYKTNMNNNTYHSIHTYIHAYLHTYTHAHTHTYINTYIHTYMHTYVHTYMHACIRACMHANIHYIHAYLTLHCISIH